VTAKIRNPFIAELGGPFLSRAVSTLFPETERGPLEALGANERERLLERVAKFTDAVEAIIKILDDVARDAVVNRAIERAAGKEYDDSRHAKLEALQKQLIISHVVNACGACQGQTRATRGAIAGLEGKFRAMRAREGRGAPSKTVSDIVSHHAMRAWRRNSKLRATDHGTAGEIAGDVNADLQKGDLKKLGTKRLSVSAIAKRIRRIPR
jgi:hypothetical protein